MKHTSHVTGTALSHREGTHDTTWLVCRLETIGALKERLACETSSSANPALILGWRPPRAHILLSVDSLWASPYLTVPGGRQNRYWSLTEIICWMQYWALRLSDNDMSDKFPLECYLVLAHLLTTVRMLSTTLRVLIPDCALKFGPASICSNLVPSQELMRDQLTGH